MFNNNLCIVNFFQENYINYSCVRVHVKHLIKKDKVANLVTNVSLLS